MTDHHALIVTGVQPVMETLNEQELAVYRMIAGRMLEAFSPKCEKETLVIETTVDGLTFRSHSVSVVKPGWRAVFNRSEDKEKDEETENKGTARFDESETVPVSGRSLAKKKTMPKPLYTEATLLAAMESCGKELADEEAREAMKGAGHRNSGDPCGRHRHPFKREYVERSGKALVPTDKGMAVYEAVKKNARGGRGTDRQLGKRRSYRSNGTSSPRKPSCAPSASMPARSLKRFFPSVSPKRQAAVSYAPSAEKGKSSSGRNLPNATTMVAGCSFSDAF